MTDREALLAAILAEPADDTARLVYADFLDDVGDHARAAIIRAGVAEPADCLVGYNYSCRGWTFNGARTLRPRGTTRRLCQELPGLDGFADPQARWIYHRGFLSTVRTTPSTWMRIGNDLCRVHPIEELQLTSAPVRIWSENDFTCSGPHWNRIRFKCS